VIERKFIAQKIRELQVQDYIAGFLSRSGHSKIEITRTPLGEKILIYTTRPGLVVGRKGENIKHITEVLKKKFKMENPQVEIADVENPMFDAVSVADQIVYSLERFGSKRFKFLGYDMLSRIINAGALGAEIVIGGRGVPGSRAKSWRFSAGYLKKSGDISENHVKKSNVVANLRSGSIGVRVIILPPDVKLPDKIKFFSDDKEIIVEEVETPEEIKEEAPKKVKKVAKKKAVKKKVKKKEKKDGSTEKK